MIHEVNNYVVAGMGANSYYGYTAANGSIRQVAALTSSGGSNYVEMDLFDNTASTVSTVLVFVGLCQRALGGRGAGSDAMLMQYQTQLQGLAAADPTHVSIGDTSAFGYFQANPSQLQDGVHPTNAGLPRWRNIGLPRL
jgi:hypothetical protein